MNKEYSIAIPGWHSFIIYQRPMRDELGDEDIWAAAGTALVNTRAKNTAVPQKMINHSVKPPYTTHNHSW